MKLLTEENTFYNEEILPFTVHSFEGYGIKLVIRENRYPNGLFKNKLQIGFMKLESDSATGFMIPCMPYTKESDLMFKRFGCHLNNIPKLVITQYSQRTEKVEFPMQVKIVSKGIEEKMTLLQPIRFGEDPEVVFSKQKHFVQIMHLECDNIPHEIAIEQVKKFEKDRSFIHDFVYLFGKYGHEPFLVIFNSLELTFIPISAIGSEKKVEETITIFHSDYHKFNDDELDD